MSIVSVEDERHLLADPALYHRERKRESEKAGTSKRERYSAKFIDL